MLICQMTLKRKSRIKTKRPSQKKTKRQTCTLLKRSSSMSLLPINKELKRNSSKQRANFLCKGSLKR